MKQLLKLFTLCFMLTCMLSATGAQAQTCAYRYAHSVKDGVKVTSAIPTGSIFYFTFNNDKSMCYGTNAQGVCNGGGYSSFRYAGTKNGMHVYNVVLAMAGGKDVLYFSTDFKRMNWLCGADNFGPTPGSIRVLEYVSDPNTVDVPDQLY